MEIKNTDQIELLEQFSPNKYKNEIYDFIENTIYMTDLLSNKNVKKQNYYGNNKIIYDRYEISFGNKINIYINLLKTDILHELKSLRKLKNYSDINVLPFQLGNVHFIYIFGILYEDIEILKELILEIYKYE